MPDIRRESPPVYRQRGTGHCFLPVLGHPDDDEITHSADGTAATYCGAPLLRHELNEYGVPIRDEGEWLADPEQHYCVPDYRLTKGRKGTWGAAFT